MNKVYSQSVKIFTSLISFDRQNPFQNKIKVYYVPENERASEWVKENESPWTHRGQWERENSITAV